MLPGQELAVDFEADDPGQWLVHGYNVYRAGLGMMTVISYLA